MKREANKAKRLVDSIRKQYDALYAKYDGEQNEMISSMKYLLPRMNKYMEDGYRLF